MSIQVGDAEMEMLNIAGDDFHPEWNYTISPRPTVNSYQLLFGVS
ncbi:MAG: hypothetical protein P8Y67_14600 [Alphaproteobacteria bacterium]